MNELEKTKNKLLKNPLIKWTVLLFVLTSSTIGYLNDWFDFFNKETLEPVNEIHSQENLIKENVNSPISNNINTQNNFYNTPIIDSLKKKDITPQDTLLQKARNKKKNINTPVINVISHNQQGGITANEVTIYNKEPEPPLESVIEILNKINPEIINRFKQGQSLVCIMISDVNLTELTNLKTKLKEEKILEYKSNGSVNVGMGNKIGDCINDLDEGHLYGFNITFLEHFDKMLN